MCNIRYLMHFNILYFMKVLIFENGVKVWDGH